MEITGLGEDGVRIDLGDKSLFIGTREDLPDNPLWVAFLARYIIALADNGTIEPPPMTTEDCEAIEWDPDHWTPAENGLLGEVVAKAVAAVKAAAPWPPELLKRAPGAFTSQVAGKLRTMGFCADWGAPPRADGTRGVHDEVAVWLPGAVSREQWDCVLSDGTIAEQPFIVSVVFRKA